MTRDEFKKGINAAAKCINERLNGICWAIENNVSSTASDDFSANYYPPNRERWSYWLGAKSEKNIENRLMFLRMFEHQALCHETYKAW